MAPEMINKQPYGPKVDVYSVGIILYKMLHGSLPFGVNEIKIKENLLNGQYKVKDTLSSKCK